VKSITEANVSDIFYSLADRESARRQFRISLFMVIALAAGAVLAGLVTPAAPAKDAVALDAVALDDGAAFTGRLVATGDR
jgi:hypothetical protein